VRHDDRVEHDEWIRSHVDPVGPLELVSDEPWATVWRVPVDGGAVWFKACAPVQAFEPHLTASLWGRWPDRVVRVLANDADRHWLLLADAGTSLRELGDPVDAWIAALPEYAELQRGEAAHAGDHIANGVPDLRVSTLPGRYDDLLRNELPIDEQSICRLRGFAARFNQWCVELDGAGVPPTLQHDDLQGTNVYRDGEDHRVIDWGDASIGHPFASMVVTLRFLEALTTAEFRNRLRDAYLEPWGRKHLELFELALRVGEIAHAMACTRQRDALPQSALPAFDIDYRVVLERAVGATV
jgi:hypothetical protein